MDIDLLDFPDIPVLGHDAWEDAVAKALGNSSLDRLKAVTADGIVVPPLSPPAATAHPVSGRAPGQPWLIVQQVEFGEASHTNAQILSELSNGADAVELTVKNDDEIYATPPEILKSKLCRVFEGVYLDMVHILISGSRSAYAIGNLLPEIAAAQGRRLAPATVLPLVDPIATATKVHSPIAIRNEAVSGISFAASSGAHHTHWKGLLSCDGQFWHAAGATDVQQLAITIATCSQVLELWYDGQQVVTAPANFAERIAVRLVADQNQFMTIARYRAFRRLWALLLDSWGLPQRPAFVHAVPAWRMMTRRDPWVNILRSTIATFGAAVGGADAITSVPHTALLGRPDDAARRLSRNVQTVLMDECNLHRVADPAAGSGAVEGLTDALAEAAWEEFRRIESEGGLIASIAADAITARVRAADEKRRLAVARRREPITGTSTYPMLAEKIPPVDPGDGWAAPGSDLTRSAEPWEALRDRSDAALAAAGQRPRVFLANLGPVAAFTLRATWAKNLFEAGGIEAVGRDGYGEAERLAAAFRASGARVACLCSDDATYAELAAPMAAALKAAGADRLYLAGRPGEAEAGLRTAGIDLFVHEGLDMLALLADLHDHLGPTAPAAT